MGAGQAGRAGQGRFGKLAAARVGVRFGGSALVLLLLHSDLPNKQLTGRQASYSAATNGPRWISRKSGGVRRGVPRTWYEPGFKMVEGKAILGRSTGGELVVDGATRTFVIEPDRVKWKID